MQARHLVIGRKYLAKVSGKIVVVRLDRTKTFDCYRTSRGVRVRSTRTVFYVTNLTTGRELQLNGAGRFRREWSANLGETK